MFLYLYCVRQQNDLDFSARGIDGRGKVFSVGYKDIEGIASNLDPREFNWEELSKKAQEDLAWIKTMAQKHETVVEKAMGTPKGGIHCAVIPMKFGTIFQSKESLAKSLAAHYRQFKTALATLKGNQEWHLKVYMTDWKAFEREVRLGSGEIQTKERTIVLLNEGAAYFAKQEIGEALREAKENAVSVYKENIFQMIRPHVQAAAHGKILPEEFTGKSVPMILNGFFLVGEKKIKNFKKTIKDLMKRFPSITFICTGPWPPYNFV